MIKKNAYVELLSFSFTYLSDITKSQIRRFARSNSLLTCNFVIFSANLSSLSVPVVFMLTASFRSASNFKIAAMWNTICTESISLRSSSSDNPKFSSAIFPATALTLVNNCGLSFLKWLKIWKQIMCNYEKLSVFCPKITFRGLTVSGAVRRVLWRFLISYSYRDEIGSEKFSQ